MNLTFNLIIAIQRWKANESSKEFFQFQARETVEFEYPHRKNPAELNQEISLAILCFYNYHSISVGILLTSRTPYWSTKYLDDCTNVLCRGQVQNPSFWRWNEHRNAPNNASNQLIRKTESKPISKINFEISFTAFSLLEKKATQLKGRTYLKHSLWLVEQSVQSS